MAETLIADLPWARLLAGNNELKLRAKTTAEGGQEAADALMFRFQVPVDNLAGSGWLGCIAADILKGNTVDGPTERVQLKLGFKLDPGPVLELYATREGGSDDRDEIRIVRFALDGAEFGVPLTGLGTPAPSSFPSAFRSDNGKYHYNVQGDPTPEYPYGRIVQYDRHGSERPQDWEAMAILKPEALT